MSNLSLKEKLLFGAVIILVILFVIYLVVISPLQTSIQEADIALENAMNKDQVYSMLKNSNDEMSSTIDEVEDQIIELEQSFLPAINTDAIVTYLQECFEANGCPYLSEVSTERIAMDTIMLPDGTVSADSLSCLRVIMTYQTTDGYNVPEYNSDPQWYTDLTINAEAVTEAIGQMGYYPIVGLEGFVNTVDQINELFPSAIKVNRVYIEDSLQGYLNMTAEIDFYAGNFTDRVSEENNDTPYVEYSGITPETGSGLLGFPILVEDENSAYYGYIIAPSSFTVEGRAFAAWFSSGITGSLANTDTPLYSIGGVIEETDEVFFVSAASEFVPTSIENVPTPVAEATEAEG